MLRGITTISFYADDVSAAQAWYGKLLGTEPYFLRSQDGSPVYAEFRIGDYQHELGIIDRRFALAGRGAQPGGAIIYWHVDDLRAVYDTLLSMGATEYEAPIERGPGFVTASVIDPFGNVLGVMYNQHYLDVLGGQ
jgi:predicted enzyme related to lactoylglutathione lyase